MLSMERYSRQTLEEAFARQNLAWTPFSVRYVGASKLAVS